MKRPHVNLKGKNLPDVIGQLDNSIAHIVEKEIISQFSKETPCDGSCEN